MLRFWFATRIQHEAEEEREEDDNQAASTAGPTVDDSKEPLSFADLPAEIRFRIYSFALNPERAITFHLHGPKTIERFVWSYRGTRRQIKLLNEFYNPTNFSRLPEWSIAVLQSMRRSKTSLTALYLLKADLEEAIKILYSENVFEFRGDCGFILLNHFLHSIGPQKRSYLRHLRIGAPLWNKPPTYGNLTGATIGVDPSRLGLSAIPRPSFDQLLGSMRISLHILRASWKETKGSKYAPQIELVSSDLTENNTRDTDIAANFMFPHERARRLRRRATERRAWRVFNRSCPHVEVTVVVERFRNCPHRAAFDYLCDTLNYRVGPVPPVDLWTETIDALPED